MSWDGLREALFKIVDLIPGLDEHAREELGMPPNSFEFETEEMSEEEKKAL